MEKDFIKEVKLMDKTQAEKYRELMKNLENVKLNLEKDYKNMQFIDNRDLVDYYTYKIKAEEAQYDFLLQEAKKIYKKNNIENNKD